MSSNMKDTITIDGIEYVRKDKILDMEFTGTLSTKPSDWYEPEEGEEYWHVKEQGVVTFFWRGDTLDLDTSKRQELFRTKEEAEAADAHRIALTAIKKYIAKEFGKWEPDMEHEGYWHLYYVPTFKKIGYAYEDSYTYASVIPGLRSKEHAKQLIKDMDEELRIVFGVK